MSVTTSPPPLLRRINLSGFSQSELLTLCALSNSNLNPSPSNHALLPSASNHSAAALPQTDSPPKLRRRRFAESASESDASLEESKLIVALFKKCMQSPATEIVDKNGVGVDLRRLEGGSDPYGEELGRRTDGMEGEGELLGFLRGLEGEWCSRRKKRRIVDAALLGDALPVGWKIVIALKRKGGRFSPFCRRYISPTGEHLPSCKEVAVYLSSYLPSSDMNLSGKVLGESQGVGSEKDAGTNPACLRFTQDAAVSGVDHLCDAQVRDSFECYKCKVKFSEKNAYVKHLLSSHENTPKRCRMGTPIGKGVIFKDGKYECQYCHKVFQDKKRYSGHVGVHVRNFNRGSEELFDAEATKCTEESSVNKMSSELSKTDALFAIAESSAEALSGSVSEKVPNADSLAVSWNSAIDSPKLEMEKTRKTAENVIEVSSAVGGIRQIWVGNKEMGIDDHQSSVYVDKSSIIPLNEESHDARTSKWNESYHEDGNALAAAAAEALSPGSCKASPMELDMGGKSTCDPNSGTDPASICTAREKRVDSLESFLSVCNRGGKRSSATGSIRTSARMAPQKLVNSVGASMKVSEKGGEGTLDTHAFASREPQKSLNSLRKIAKVSASSTDVGSARTSASTVPQKLSSSQASPKGIESSSGTRKGHASPITTLQKPSSSFKRKKKTGGSSCISHNNIISASIAPQMPISTVPENRKNWQGDKNSSDVDAKQQCMIELDDITLQEPESGKNNTAAESVSIVPGADPMKANGMEESEAAPPPSGARKPVKTVCVWCGTSFFPAAAVSEAESDSVGYMCTSCRTKISKQISELEKSWGKT